jgi:hypothetical protein
LLVDEVAAYLASAGIGLTTASPNPNLFTNPFPLGGPDEAVCLVPWNTTTVDTFGESLSAPAMEVQSFKVISRGKKDKAKAAETKAYAVYKKLRRLGPVTLSGVKYHHIEAQPPIWLSDDETGRPRYHFDAVAWKAESP